MWRICHHRIPAPVHTAGMAKRLAYGVHIVAVNHNGKLEHWAAATHRWEAVEAVRKRLPASATAKLSKRFLTREQLAELKLRPNEVRRLKDAAK
jgi:hypothetical protein